MKNRELKYSILFFLIMLAFTSCKKFLDEKSSKNLSELKTLDDLQAMLDDNGVLNSSSTPGFGETSADDYFVQPTDYPSLNGDARSAYTWEPYDYQFTNDWSVAYKGVYVANYCLHYIDKIPVTTSNASQWNNVMGSAFFLRAYQFLNLVWVYGKAYDDNSSQTDLGIALRLSYDPSVPSVRATVKDCYDRVLMDAKQAAAYLPNFPQHVMRPSKAAAYGLLARTYLSMRKYDSAFKYSDLSLQIKKDLYNYNAAGTTFVCFPAFNPEIIFYSTQTTFYRAKEPQAFSLVDTVLYVAYDGNDRRRDVFFKKKTGTNYSYFQGTYSTVRLSDLFSGIATDEMFLTRAECNARAGNLPAVKNDLDTLLVKRWKTGTYVPVIISNQQQAINLVLLERRKELLMRGLRWIDIKRLNKEGANIILKRVVPNQVYTLLPNSDKYALPLPKDIIELTGMPQNPGW